MGRSLLPTLGWKGDERETSNAVKESGWVNDNFLAANYVLCHLLLL